MRLWSLNPALLDRQGLTACWREGLLAQAVLLGRTQGYTAHPQLDRFREHPQPVTAISAYLHGVRDEATRRGYRFDERRISQPLDGQIRDIARIVVTTGQLDREWQHLLHKLAARSPVHRALIVSAEPPTPHPLFVVVPGPVASWERAS
ncbi:pyrimidine dimer DNA glycosylase/endonuclease V [Promicromonospora panici]|uniref:pyrimidine dimer DNA glycosylase/endonuclease V n=1 Tax=Promicromonospora panici TaxID=2219658 RepID=UPI00101DABC9|nr:pyrimidine dimer DNA glycosylase/endonuclease V [Promicromonospora panici]